MTSDDSSTGEDQEQSDYTEDTTLSEFMANETIETTNEAKSDSSPSESTERSSSVQVTLGDQTDDRSLPSENEFQQENHSSSPSDNQATEKQERDTLIEFLEIVENTIYPILKKGVVGGATTAGHRIKNGSQKISDFIMACNDPEAGLSGSYYPHKMIREDEEVIWADTPSRWTALGPYSLATMFFAAGILYFFAERDGYVTAYFAVRSPTFLDVPIPEWTLIVFPMFLFLVGTFTVVGEILQRGSTWYILTDSRLIYRTNPFNRNRERIPLHQITKADDKYPIPIRFVGLGSIDIFTASTDGMEFRFRAMRRPGERADDIDEQRAYQSGSTETGADGEDHRLDQKSEDADNGGGVLSSLR